MLTTTSFAVKKTDESYELIFGEQVIARGDVNYGFELLRDLVVTPGGEALISFHQLAPTTFGRSAACPAISTEADRATLRFADTSGDGTLRQATKVTVTYDEERGAFLWDFVHQTTFLADVVVDRFFGRTDVDPRYADTGVYVFEITDPMPHRAFAPKDGPVPIDRPDILFPQAWFRKGGWQKNWSHFVFTRDDGAVVRIPMNHLENHDKDFWKQAPDGYIAMLGGEGTNLRYRLLEGSGRNICHHYCMWGYDIHFFEIVGTGTGDGTPNAPTIASGTEFYHHYVLETVTDGESQSIIDQAIDHPWRERDEQRLANVARYNPGLNLFQRGLGRQDDTGFFQPSTMCQFLPRHPGRRTPGVLAISNDYAGPSYDGAQLYNAWLVTLGSDNWHTPIESNRIYEITVWAKLEPADEGAFARISMQYVTQQDQATPQWTVERSPIFFSNEVHGKTGWTKMVLRTPRLPEDYVSVMNIGLEFRGRGLCYFDEFACLLLEE
ncbi:MAG TPA: hypothetical protein VGM23_06950 [Armatimonadota bacterium]